MYTFPIMIEFQILGCYNCFDNEVSFISIRHSGPLEFLIRYFCQIKESDLLKPMGQRLIYDLFHRQLDAAYNF